MVSPTPSTLKSTDINRFLIRAAQLEKLKPPIAYWCYYWAVNQILSKNLHMHDDECKQYTTELMDKLEEIKEQHSTDDSIMDDMAGQAYVEQFGSETFQRAENAIRANKASKQTADTFQAAATFFSLIHIWGEPSPEIASKVKYAKYHALRIAKALVAGEDPNLTNPVAEPEHLDEPPAQVPIVPQEDGEAMAHISRQPSVEEVPDEGVELQARMARQSSLDESLHPSRAPSIPRGSTLEVGTRLQPEDSSGQKTGESYFPEASHAPSSVHPPPVSLDAAIGLDSSGLPLLPTESVSLPPSTSENPVFSSFQPGASNVTSPSEFYTQPLTDPVAPLSPPLPRPEPQRPRNIAPPPVPVAAQIHHAVATHSAISQNYLTDDMAVLDAQKHAKWAISALNFEDVPTAVKELREALKSLGGL